MAVIETTDEVEGLAMAWLQRKYAKRLGKVKFVEVMKEAGVWNVKAEAKLATGILSVAPHLVSLRIDSETTKILGYSEAPIAKHES